MKKISFLLIFTLVLLVFWCWKKKIDVTQTEFEYSVDICDRYFELARCIIDNDNNENWTKEMKDELRLAIKNRQEERKALSEDQLKNKCTEMMNALLKNPTYLDKVWCSVN